MKSTLFLTSLISAAGLASAAECPAPGSTDAQGRYSCNPAHSYPNGQRCLSFDGCYFLTDASGKPIDNRPVSSAVSTTAAAAPSASTTACPAPGSTDPQGRYSCNPAHSYPNGQRCLSFSGCYFLTDSLGQPIDNRPRSSASASSASAKPTGSACPAPGSTDAQGRYSCNPAHQYPNGQRCLSFDGCYYLTDASGKPIDNCPPPKSSGAATATAPATAAPATTAGAATTVSTAIAKPTSAASTGSNVTATGQPPAATQTAGASTLQGAGLVALVAAFGALL